jgi:hypothetical protein
VNWILLFWQRVGSGGMLSYTHYTLNYWLWNGYVCSTLWKLIIKIKRLVLWPIQVLILHASLSRYQCWESILCSLLYKVGSCKMCFCKSNRPAGDKWITMLFTSHDPPVADPVFQNCPHTHPNLNWCSAHYRVWNTSHSPIAIVTVLDRSWMSTQWKMNQFYPPLIIMTSFPYPCLCYPSSGSRHMPS